MIYGVLTFNMIALSLKVYLYILTLSLAVLVYAVDSLVDALNDVVALRGSKIAGKPPDLDHPYGHIKYEYLAFVM